MLLVVVVVCVVVVLLRPFKTPVCPSKTSPCVRPRPPRVCRHHAHMLKHVCAWCQYTRGRFGPTHGGVFESTHGGFAAFHTTTQDTTHKTQHTRHTRHNTNNTQQHTTTHHNNHHNNTRRHGKKTEKEDIEMKDKTREKMKDKTREMRR